MRKIGWTLAALALLSTCIGCVSVKAPERIDIGGSRHESVDSSSVPRTSSHEEAKVELRKAYRYIRALENEVDDLEQDQRECERERERCEDRLERYEDD